jgi:hypothetical protein
MGKVLGGITLLPPYVGFRLVGEQTDGSFLLGEETYLLESKWQNEQTGIGQVESCTSAAFGRVVT